MAENTNKKKTSAKTTNTKTTAKASTTKTSTVKPKNSTTNAGKTNTKKVVEVKKPVEEVKVEEPKKVVKEEKTVNAEKTPIVEVVKANATLIFLCIICLLLIINIILIARGHKVKLSNGNEVIASIDGKEVTAEEIFESIKETYGTNALVNTIDEFIVEKEATKTEDAEKKAQEQVASIKAQYEAMNYTWSEVLTNYGYGSEQDLLDEIKMSILKEEVATTHMKNNLTDAEIEKYYNENVEDSYTAKHILITPDTTSDMSNEQIAAMEEAARVTAEEVIARLNNGEDWSSLVAAYSEDEGSKSSDGLIENFTKGEVVDEFFEATKNLSDNTYSTTPVKSKFGYHIIYRVSKTDKEALESMKNELIAEIVESKLANDQTAYANAWAEIRNKYHFTINDTTISNYYNKAIKGE